MTARQAAQAALTACQTRGAWADGELKKLTQGMDSREAGLASILCYGVLQNRLLLDFYLNTYSKIKTEKLERRVHLALQIGLFQILWLDRVPDSAAVNESVRLVERQSPRAVGFVNGLLRAIAREKDALPRPKGDVIRRLSIEFSHPEWIVKEFSLTLGEAGAAALLAANNAPAPMTAQVNTRKTTSEQLSAALTERGIAVTAHPWLADCLLLEHTGSLEGLDLFQTGQFYIQDPASRLAVMASGIGAGMSVLDACAAPGGKSFAAALQGGGAARITARDIHPHKERLISEGAARLGLGEIAAETRDAREPGGGTFDVVLADLPCSGLGIIRKKPDIRYKDPALLADLPVLQGEILRSLADSVRPGGVLLYSTCTLLQRENGDVTASFLSERSDFTREGFVLPGPVGEVPGGEITLYPHIHGADGFYIARLRRRT